MTRGRFLAGWLRSAAFTFGLLALVAAAVGDRGHVFPLVIMGVAGAGVGALYLIFPHGLHFALGTANGLAVYACLYVFIGRAGFPDAEWWARPIGFLLPVAGFVLACWAWRPALRRAAESVRPVDMRHLPRIARWLLALAAIGTVSLALPEDAMSPRAQALALLLAQGLVTAVVVAAVQDVVKLLVDVALIFEQIAGRIGHLAVPVVAYVTVYSFIAIAFACLYRIADGLSRTALFASSQAPFRIDFSDALHFSLVTLSTVGYGDIHPTDDGIRVLASLEVMLGQLLLLFGFAEIMRSSQLLRRPPREGHGHDPD